MWTPTTRQQHSRPVKRYQTDLTDAEWCVIAPHLPKPCATGRPREWPMREILRAGCPWRLLPNDLPPWGTIYRWFAAWRRTRLPLRRIRHAARASDRSRFMTSKPTLRPAYAEAARIERSAICFERNDEQRRGLRFM
jgi:transposase